MLGNYNLWQKAIFGRFQESAMSIEVAGKQSNIENHARSSFVAVDVKDSKRRCNGMICKAAICDATCRL